MQKTHHFTTSPLHHLKEIVLYLYKNGNSTFKMNSPEIKAFIRQNSNLFWYTPDDKKEEIGPEFLVETILNYGDMNQIKTLIGIIGIKEMSRIFFRAEGRKKLNYYPEIYNFFSLIFSRYA